MDTIGGVDRLLGNHRETVFALCLRVLRHRQDAEDACQEALLKVARCGPGEGDPARLAAWVHQVALRTAIDHHRAKVRRKAREDKAAEQVPSPAAEADPMVPIAEALSELPEDERTLLVDHFFGRKTLRVLADERGCSEPAVWKRVEKSKDRLRKVLMAAAPAAVLAMNGFLEAVERPARWTPWRLAVTAVVPAIVVAVLAVVGLHRRPVSEPAPQARAPMASAFTAPVLPAEGTVAAPSAAPVRPAETPLVIPPYPYELPPRHWPEAKRAAWLKLDRTRIDLSAENTLLHEVLLDLSARSGIPIRLAPDIPVPSTPVTFKVKDLILRNVLTLLLSQFTLGFDLGSDGSVWVSSAKGIRPEPDPLFEEIRSARQGLDTALRAMDGGAKDVPVEPVWVLLRSKEFSIPPGEYALIQMVERLRHETGLNTALSVAPTGDPQLALQERELLRQIMELESLNRPGEARALSPNLRDLRRKLEKTQSRPFPGGVRTLEGHLQVMAATWNVGWAPSNGTLMILDPGPAAEEMARAKAEKDALAAAAARLDQPALDPFPTTIFQLADALARDTGLNVVPSEKAWAAPTRASGETWKTVLEKLPAQGFRWLLQNGTVYIDR